ncbi:MAG: GH35 family endo-1,4-beta-xylanase, partial [Arcticibacterium sp.]
LKINDVKTFCLFLKNKAKISSVIFWGINGGNNWKNNSPMRG